MNFKFTKLFSKVHPFSYWKLKHILTKYTSPFAFMLNPDKLYLSLNHNSSKRFTTATQGIEGYPEVIRPSYKGSSKLDKKVALITGGAVGIGRSIAVHFAREGADIAIAYLTSDQNYAKETQEWIEKEGQKCLLLPGDLREIDYCESIVEQTAKHFNKLNILVNNAGICNVPSGMEDISEKDLKNIFDVNTIALFRVTKAALKYLKEGDTIINAASMVAYGGLSAPVDYGTTKGAVVGFTRSLSGQLADRKIRVNMVAPGYIDTRIINCLNEEQKKATIALIPMKRKAQPSEIAPSYVFLASEDSSYFTGQCLHPNGGFLYNA